MSFWGRSFVFNGVPSETYNVYISSPDGGDVEIDASNTVEVLRQSIYRRVRPYLFGVAQNEILTFPVSVNAPNELTAVDSRLIQRWLFGHNNYKNLQIVQPDLQDVVMYAMMNNPKLKRNGNYIVGFTFDCECDSPFGWTFPVTKTYTYTSNPNGAPIVFNNQSDDNYYNYPIMEFTMDVFGGDLTIVNTSDNSRVFQFIGLAAGETVTVNNSLEILSSSTGLLRLSTFNKKFFRFVPGVNVLNVTGDISSLKFTYEFARKLGG